MLDKQKLRRELRRQRSLLTLEQARRSGELVARQVLASEVYQNARVILGFLSFGKELSVDAVLEDALKAGKLVAVPYIDSPTSFVCARLRNMSDFALDRYGIRTVREPLEIIAPTELELVLVPGVAFAVDGGRMGMGAGYYDRFLPRAGRALTMGIAYDMLLQEQLPCDEHDVRMRFLASESGVRECVALADK